MKKLRKEPKLNFKSRLGSITLSLSCYISPEDYEDTNIIWFFNEKGSDDCCVGCAAEFRREKNFHKPLN